MVRSCLFILVLTLSTLINAQSGTYRIYALKFAERKRHVPMDQVAVGDRSGDSTKGVFMYWVLKSKERVILVDAGFTSDAGFDTNAIRFTPPDHLLPSIDVRRQDITDIIITHPHWDHLGGIDLYPQAMVWMQEADYNELLENEKDPGARGFDERDIVNVRERKAKGTITLLKGLRDQDILPGITVFIAGSKHTAGSQFVRANNGRQAVIIASDNCKYYRNLTHMLSSPATTDQKAYIRNLKVMKQWAAGDPDLVIPGHDPLVFTRFKAVAKDVVEIVKE